MLGDNFLAYLTLALGAALALGTGTALVKPRVDEATGETIKAPIGRSLIQITIGTVAAVWGLATLLS
ncbi:MAG: hypothetical protein OEY41_10590 [Acidimicrobiia bacterium]|nr:hypothetical protein [Acidimicrobiia bacterium]MDH4363486.1 hypothetical protein [Acidimicrobiia bacterium]MDH5290432.1 hypothetical protein [Acidimicrobiia bacterium]